MLESKQESERNDAGGEREEGGQDELNVNNGEAISCISYRCKFIVLCFVRVGA